VKIKVTEYHIREFTIELPDCFTTYDKVDKHTERQRLKYDGPVQESVSQIEWSHVLETNRDVAKTLALFKPTFQHIPFNFSGYERECWLLYITDCLPAGGAWLNYRTWLNTGAFEHHPDRVAECFEDGDSERIYVHFRVAPEGDVVALWGEPDRRGLISSYQHVGQHGDASPELVADWRVATAAEKADLFKELEGRGYVIVDKEPKA